MTKDPSPEVASDHLFYEELTKWIPADHEYYDFSAWTDYSEFEEEREEDSSSDEDDLPSLIERFSLGINHLKGQVENIVDHVSHATEEYWATDDDVEDVESDDKPISDEENVSDNEEELPPPPKGSIWDAAFPDPPHKPHLPDKPHLPGKPKLPDLPHKPNLPHPPKKPHPPHHPHWPPHHRHGPNPHFKYINHTILEFLANSTHHKILYHLVKNDSSLIALFNDTSKHGNVTLFAPTDCAFKKIIHHLPKNHTYPPKWLIRKVLEYHTLDGFWPIGRVLHHRTIPTLLEAHHGPNLTQKIRVGFGLRGLNLNFYVHPVFVNIFTSNGVVHAVDNILIPPPPTYRLLQVVPTVFSTFFQALHQTHVATDFFPWKKPNSSWTVFAPGNLAWAKIPLPVTAFLFSPHGHRILTKLVQYHISPNTTFYTDSIWKFPKASSPEDGDVSPPTPNEDFAGDDLLLPRDEEFAPPPPLVDFPPFTPDDFPPSPHKRPGHPHKPGPPHKRPGPPHRFPPFRKEHYNTTLPTLIGKNATLRIDEFKFGPIVKVAINGRPSGLKVNDVVTFDGVIHIIDRFILPPRRSCHKRPGHHQEMMVEEQWVEGFAEEEEWTIENLIAIFGEE